MSFCSFVFKGCGCYQIFQIIQLLDLVSCHKILTFANDLQTKPKHLGSKKRYALSFKQEQSLSYLDNL